MRYDALPVTLPRSIGPHGVSPDDFFGWGSSHGNDKLWVGGLWPRGIIPGGPEFAAPDGSVGMRFGWWRAATGKLQVTGWRLDAPAPPARAHVPDGYGDTTLVAWEVSARKAGGTDAGSLGQSSGLGATTRTAGRLAATSEPADRLGNATAKTAIHRRAPVAPLVRGPRGRAGRLGGSSPSAMTTPATRPVGRQHHRRPATPCPPWPRRCRRPRRLHRRPLRRRPFQPSGSQIWSA